MNRLFVVAFTLFMAASCAIARADLWINIKAPATVADVSALPGIACELMDRSTTKETVRCSNRVDAWDSMGATVPNLHGQLRWFFLKWEEGGHVSECKVFFNYTGAKTDRWDATAREPCRQYWQNNNTLDLWKG